MRNEEPASDTPPRHGAADYARGLLASLGEDATAVAASPASPEADWAASGLLALTGAADAEPRPGPGVLPSCAHGALLALSALAGRDLLPGCHGGTLLAERAALLGLRRRGRTSANGTCRLLAARDGWIALSLARDDDVALLPAWLEDAGTAAAVAAVVAGSGGAAPDAAAVAPAIAECIADRVAAAAARPLVARGRLLGLPVAGLADSRAGQWMRSERLLAASRPASGTTPVVVDLSALWAGPLCTHLLAAAGARVIKVESAGRPDAARDASPAFFDLLNAGKESVVLDLPRPRAVRQLAALLAGADIVVESARPRALSQMGIDAAACVRARPGRTWLSITGYGRHGEAAMHVAFGDDAAVAAGLVGTGPVFCGDAICDPLTGLHAALAAFAAWRGGGGVLLDVALARVGACCLAYDPRQRQVPAGGAVPPRARRAAGRAAAFGADTARVLAEFAC
jgi:crotonobetainyl-CoA:carnitine CoA-transferase CaiB-like acyl-CoA transferase